MAGSTHQSIERAAAILRVFTEHEPEIGVGEIARRLDLHKSTVSRILATLLDEGMVWHNPETGRYSLGMALVELAGVALGQIDVRAAAMPYMERMGLELDETVNVSVLRNADAVTVAHVPSKQSIRHVVWIGRRTPLPTTASGKVFLAWSEIVYTGVAERASPVTPAAPGGGAPGGPSAMELETIRRVGYATEVDEFEDGTSAVAAPIRDATGAVVAALSVAAPSFRFGLTEIVDAAPSVVGTADAISADLGSRHPVAMGGERLW